MLWKEITLGFLLAGFVAQLGNGFFNALFLRNAPAPLPTIENVIVGPLIAVLSFVCSVGNVPAGGGAVVGRDQLRRRARVPLRRPDRAADPRDLPQVLRPRFTLRITALMFVTMVIAALIVNGLFSALGADPDRPAPDPRRHLRHDPASTTSSR